MFAKFKVGSDDTIYFFTTADEKGVSVGVEHFLKPSKRDGSARKKDGFLLNTAQATELRVYLQSQGF